MFRGEDHAHTIWFWLVGAVALCVGAAIVGAAMLHARSAPSKPATTRPALLRRGAHVSAGLQPFAFAGSPKRPRRTGVVSCSRPGPTNHVANCKSDGRPAVEPWIVADGRMLYAAANDYDTWNGQAGLGFYWSRDGRTWFDAGPLDLFPHADRSSGSGDPQLAVDARGRLYYSFSSFSFTACTYGGVGLAVRDPARATWRVVEIARNSRNALQDRPSIAVAGSRLYFAWTRFSSCSGEEGPSRAEVAIFATTGQPRVPATALTVPGSQYSRSAVLAADGRDGFWIAWEEYPSASADDGRIELAHWTPSGGWSPPRVISPPSFRDLPDPLPGFRFATGSTPAVAVAGGTPYVAWASGDAGTGRIWLWSPSGAATVDDKGVDQLFPALARDGHGGVAVSFTRADRRHGSLVRVLAAGGRTRVVSTLPSYPNRDVFFSGKFIGDYAGMALFGTTLLPIWADLRSSPGGTDPATAMTAR